MIEKLPELVNKNEALIRKGRWLNDVFLVEVGDVQYLIYVAAGRVERVEIGPFVMPSWTFAIRGSEAMWHRFWQPVPCLLYTSPSPRDGLLSRMPSSA